MLVGCGGGKGRVQISRRELHTYIHLDYARVEFLLGFLINLKPQLFENDDKTHHPFFWCEV